MIIGIVSKEEGKIKHEKRKENVDTDSSVPNTELLEGSNSLIRLGLNLIPLLLPHLQHTLTYGCKSWSSPLVVWWEISHIVSIIALLCLYIIKKVVVSRQCIRGLRVDSGLLII